MANQNPFLLLFQRRFGPLFLTQLLGAFNDNVFRNALLVLIAFQAGTVVDPATLSNLATGLFILPFLLLSALAGQLADKYEKARLIRLVKLLEILIMVVAAVGFYRNDLTWLLAALTALGVQSTLFGPLKYSILPQQLSDRELVGGNAWIALSTTLAILLGSLTGGWLISRPGGGAGLVTLTLFALATLGYLGSLAIPRAEPVAPELRLHWNVFAETWRNLAYAGRHRSVFLSMLGISWFWLLGASYLTQLPAYTRLDLGGSEQVVMLLLMLFTLGTALGALLCDGLSHQRVELGLVPLGALGLTVFGLQLALTPLGDPPVEPLTAAAFLVEPSRWPVIVNSVLLGLAGSLYVIPLYALVQQRSDAEHRSRLIAGINILNALFMGLAALLAVVLLDDRLANLSIPRFFLVLALLNAVVTLYIFRLVPEFLMRFLVWGLIHLVYRVRTQGLDQIPDRGPLVLVCNHVSFVDAPVLAGCCRRPIRFVMDHRIFKVPVLNFIFRTAGAIPIAPAREDVRLLERAYERIAAYLDAGEVVCLFPEGRLTTDGDLGPFRPGIERILQRNPVPVIPLALQGLWGSFFSRAGGHAMRRWPRGPWSRIGLVVGSPLPPAQVTATDLRERVAALRGNWR
jgi:1-acyl-sn-glycerol-3-phosphate acyltransferase